MPHTLSTHLSHGLEAPGGIHDQERSCALFCEPAVANNVRGECANCAHSVAALHPAPPLVWPHAASSADASPQKNGEAAAAFITDAQQCLTGAHAVQAAGSSGEPDGLTGPDMGALDAVLEHEMARTTVTNYRAQWGVFVRWTANRSIRALPADPRHVAAYLAERVERLGHKPATLRVAAAAIAFVHNAAGMDNPCSGPDVKRTLRSAARKVGRSQKQAEALTAEAFGAIRSSAQVRRRGRGGKLESLSTARDRGTLDVAVIGLMRDAMLRVSEAASLTWEDIRAESDGTGRLVIRRSKTDAEGQGAVAFVSAPTMAALELVRNKGPGSGSVIGLRPNQISSRIKRAAQAAGLGDHFSGHSPRVGMARDLARAGIELPSLMTAGRWRTAVMPAHYIRNETAGRGAVAQLYGFSREQGQGGLQSAFRHPEET